MVMDVTPSPQCVGREFVRQYYTLLNKAPTHVHRFYNNNSSFVHGGLLEFNRGEAAMQPAVGQKQIHRCIQQLDFRDCHAKITQVDSQATLGNGVVVQVTGELSNGGQPMRRFTQTFVLGAQSPKQYYVHNDIFRYQDLVFADDEPDQEQNPFDHEEEEPDLPQPQDIPPQAQMEQAQYYPSAPPMPTMNGTPLEEPRVNPPSPTPPPPAPAPVPAQRPPSPTPPPPAPLAQPPTYIMTMEPQPQPQQRPIVQEQEWSQEANQEDEEEGVGEEEKANDDWQDVPEPPPAAQPVPVDQSPPPAEPVSLSNEPKTYASTLVKSGGGISNFNTSPNAPPKSPPSPPPTFTRLESRNNETNAQRSRGGGGVGRGGPGPNVRGMGGGRGDGRSPSARPANTQDDYPRTDYGSRDQQGRDSDQASVEGGMERRRPPNIYSDDHQLFLGNLPLHASEADLRDLFRQFGNIVDLRIMSKSNMKSQNGNKVPNYGFIIFESIEHVQATLSARPIYFPGEPSVKLNVEEKKTKPRMDGGGGRGGGGPRPQPGMGGIPRGGMSRGGQRGGFTRGARPAGFTQRGGPR